MFSVTASENSIFFASSGGVATCINAFVHHEAWPQLAPLYSDTAKGFEVDRAELEARFVVRYIRAFAKGGAIVGDGEMTQDDRKRKRAANKRRAKAKAKSKKGTKSTMVDLVWNSLLREQLAFHIRCVA